MAFDGILKLPCPCQVGSGRSTTFATLKLDVEVFCCNAKLPVKVRDVGVNVSQTYDDHSRTAMWLIDFECTDRSCTGIDDFRSLVSILESRLKGKVRDLSRRSIRMAFQVTPEMCLMQ